MRTGNAHQTIAKTDLSFGDPVVVVEGKRRKTTTGFSLFEVLDQGQILAGSSVVRLADTVFYIQEKT